MVNVLYIHGMGGGSDSRIPSILRDALAPRGIAVICRTYDFDPEIAAAQISSMDTGAWQATVHAVAELGLSCSM